MRALTSTLLACALLTLAHSAEAIQVAPRLFVANSSTVAATVTPTSSGDSGFLLMSGALVSLMTPGLAFFYGGLVESQTVLNTLMMAYVCSAIVTVQAGEKQ